MRELLNNFKAVKSIDENTFQPMISVSFDLMIEPLADTSIRMNDGELGETFVQEFTRKLREEVEKIYA